MAAQIITVETPGLGDRSYVAHDGDVGFVVDPQRDIDRVLAAAGDAGVAITHVFETHVHNDYVSGGLALCRAVGATLVAAADSDLSFEWQRVGDGDEVEVGEMVVRAVHTPGHTHEHLAYVLIDDGRDRAVFTGGSLLFGTVGRTDLLGDDSAEELSRAQWRSARRLITDLADTVSVHPTHGFGSFCSSRGGAERSSGTIADEAADNIVLEVDDVDEFVTQLLEGLAEYPAYYAHMAHLNRAGAAAPDMSPPVTLDPAAVRRRLEAGEWVIDLRNRRAFAAGHLLGSVGFEIDGPFVTYVGWLIPWGSPVTLIGDDVESIATAQRELVRIGIDRPAGAAAGPLHRIAGDHPVEHYRVATFADLAAELGSGRDGAVVVDVRRRGEWEEGHVAGSLNLPIHELLGHLHHVPDGRLWVHCASGARAAIAASLLSRAGYEVVLVDDHVDAAADAGLPME